MLKNKFANNWVSVRKAFLDIDFDNDGLIKVEDLMKHFGHDSAMNIEDLKKIIKDRASNGVALSYADFSKWVGNTIHSVEGFYFRHDSVKNPAYEKSRILQKQKNQINRQALESK